MSKDLRSSAEDRTIQLRLPRQAMALIEHAAAQSGSSMSAFIIEAARQAAAQALDPLRPAYLEPEDFKALMEALDRPPAPSERLRAAFERYQRTVISKGDGEPQATAERRSDVFATAELRTHLSPATTRVLIRLATLWGLTDAQASALFGMDVTRWNHMKAELWEGALSQDQLTRASLLLGLYRYLRVLLPDDHAHRWPGAANAAPILGGRSAIEAMIAGGIPQMIEVRRYVAALAAGN